MTTGLNGRKRNLQLNKTTHHPNRLIKLSRSCSNQRMDFDPRTRQYNKHLKDMRSDSVFSGDIASERSQVSQKRHCMAP